MELKSVKFAFPSRVAVMVVLFIAIFMANATHSFAATHKKSEVNKTAVEYTESRIKQLKSALKITADQEALWGKVTQAMRENAKSMDALNEEMVEKGKSMNAVEYVKFHSQISEAQVVHQKKFIPPFEALYAGLSNEQKATIDSIFRTGKHGKFTIK